MSTSEGYHKAIFVSTLGKFCEGHRMIVNPYNAYTHKLYDNVYTYDVDIIERPNSHMDSDKSETFSSNDPQNGIKNRQVRRAARVHWHVTFL